MDENIINQFNNAIKELKERWKKELYNSSFNEDEKHTIDLIYKSKIIAVGEVMDVLNETLLKEFPNKEDSLEEMIDNIEEDR